MSSKCNKPQRDISSSNILGNQFDIKRSGKQLVKNKNISYL